MPVYLSMYVHVDISCTHCVKIKFLLCYCQEYNICSKIAFAFVFTLTCIVVQTQSRNANTRQFLHGKMLSEQPGPFSCKTIGDHEFGLPTTFGEKFISSGNFTFSFSSAVNSSRMFSLYLKLN